MNHIRENPTFVIVVHCACRTCILAIKNLNAFPVKFLYFISSPCPSMTNMVLRTVTRVEVERGQGSDPDPDQKHPDPGRCLPAGSSKLFHFDKEFFYVPK